MSNKGKIIYPRIFIEIDNKNTNFCHQFCDFLTPVAIFCNLFCTDLEHNKEKTFRCQKCIECTTKKIK